MAFVTRWGSGVTTRPPRRLDTGSPRPTTLAQRPTPVDLESSAKSLGSQVGRPFVLKYYPMPAGPTNVVAVILPPVEGPTDLTAS